MSPIQMGLQDAHPYVRRTAVMGVLKVYHLDQGAVRNAGPLSLPRRCIWAPLHACISGRPPHPCSPQKRTPGPSW